MNTVIRKCNKCGHKDDSRNFPYIGSGVFACPKCGYKRTHIDEVIEG